MTTTTITLGGRDFAIEPLKLGQLRALLDALDDLNGKTGGAVIDAAARVIHAALIRSIPDLTLDAVLDHEATMDEVTAAVGAILEAAGLSRTTDDGVGEAMPAASPIAPPPAAAANG